MAPPQPSLMRTAGYGGLLIVLLVVPTLLGFRIAAAGHSDPPEPGEIVAVVPPADDPATDVPQVVSERALGDAPASASDALTRAEDTGPGFARLTFIDATDGRFDIDNGVPIPLGDGLDLAVVLDPYPPDRFSVEVGFELTRDGEPVSGATFDTSWDMTFMFHGPFDTRLAEAAAGSHTADYEFFMFGPWRLDTVVSGVSDEPIEFAIEIYVWPN